jgi:hypothetical protein
MTAHNASTAPNTSEEEFDFSSMDEDTPNSSSEEFLANLAYDLFVTQDDEYPSPDNIPVHITASMMLTLPAEATSTILPASTSPPIRSRIPASSSVMDDEYAFELRIPRVGLYERGVRLPTQDTRPPNDPTPTTIETPLSYIDATTHMVLTTLMKTRKRTEQQMKSILEIISTGIHEDDVAKDGEYEYLDQFHNDTNRSMHRRFPTHHPHE